MLIYVWLESDENYVLEHLQIDFFSFFRYFCPMGMLKLYIDYFKSKLKNLRKPKEDIPIDYEEIVEEQWQADFSKPENCRFAAETGDGYTAAFTPPDPAGTNTGGITLEAQRKHL